MALIKLNDAGAPAVVEKDSWQLVADDADIPATGDVIVGLSRFLDGVDALKDRAGQVGVRVDPKDELDGLVAHLADLSWLQVNFPKFADGRGFTKARLLKDRHGFAGELRAVGDVLSDQLLYMKRCGFDAFDLKDGKNTDNALSAMAAFSVRYQSDAEEPQPLYRRLRG